MRIKTAVFCVVNDILFQVDNEENAVVKIPKTAFNKLSKDEAIDIALKQQSVQDVLSEKTITKVLYTSYVDYQAVVHIRTLHEKKAVRQC